MDVDRNIIDELTPKEKGVITEACGPLAAPGGQPSPKRSVTAVYPMTAEQQQLFDQTASESSRAIQELFKYRGAFVPIRFNKELQRFIQEEPLLRSGFLKLERRSLRVVFNSILPENMVFRNITGYSPFQIDNDLYNFMSADMLRGFNLAQPPLFRLAVFHTGRDEYAIVLTMPGILKDALNIPQLLNAASPEPASDSSLDGEKKETPAGYPADRAREIPTYTEKARRYWAELLSGLPPHPVIPYFSSTGGPFVQKSYRLPGLEAYEEILAHKSGENTDMFRCILQTAWGLFLQYSNDSNDTYYFILSPPDRNQELPQGTGRAMVPVRLRTDPSLTMEALVSRQFLQSVSSRPYSRPGRNWIRPLMGDRPDLFDHILSFEDFGGYTKAPASACGTPVTANTWNMRGVPLGIYFHFLPEGISATFLYDASRFSPGGLEKLAWEYEMTLYFLLTLWDQPVSVFREKLAAGIAGSDHAASAEKKKPLAEYLSELPLFSGLSDAALAKLAAHAGLDLQYEGALVTPYGETPALYFLAEGQVARHLDNGSGWHNFLDISFGGAWLNETVLLPACKSKLALEVLSDEARILTVPAADFEPLLSEDPALARRVLTHALKEMDKYERRWVET